MMLNRRLVGLAKDVKGQIALTVGLGLAITATYIGQGILVAGIVADILTGRLLLDILPSLLWMMTLIAIRAFLLRQKDVSAIATVAAVKERLRARLYAHLLHLGPGYLERTRTGDVQATLVDGVEALEGYMGYYIPQAFIALIAPIFILAYVALINPISVVLIAISILFGLFAPRVWDRVLGEHGRKHWDSYSHLHAQFLDSMQGMTTLKAFNASARRGRELEQDAQHLYRATMKQMGISLMDTGFLGLAIGIGTAFAIGSGAIQLTQHQLSLSALFTILFLASECFRPLADLSSYWHQGFMGISASSGIFALLDAQPEVTDALVAASFVQAPIQPSLAFENVTFGYSTREKPAIQSLSFAIAAGERVALVGRSGAGKTTTVSLLFRFFDPQSGRITLAGRDLREYPLETIRRLMAVVSQDTYLFYGTVADNLRFAKPDATEAELKAAARAANAHEFIETLPNGWNTLIGERGLKLSGGQRQRLAIARALLKDVPILILDEATSSVDAASESLIQEALDRLTANRTTLVIAHRLSTVVNADRIVVLDAGQAVESGRHDLLLEKQGAYARLIAAQAPLSNGD